MASGDIDNRYLQFKRVPQHNVNKLKRDNFNSTQLNKAILHGDRYFGTSLSEKNEGMVNRGMKQRQRHNPNPMMLFREGIQRETYYNGRSFRL